VGRRVASVAMINAARRYWPRRTRLVDAGIALAALAVTLGLGQGGSPSRHDLDEPGLAGLAASPLLRFSASPLLRFSAGRVCAL
jgi:hypothetical protein